MNTHKYQDGSISIPTVEIGNVAHEILNYRSLKDEDIEWDAACGQVVNNVNIDLNKKGFVSKGVFYINSRQQLLFVPKENNQEDVLFEKVKPENVHY